MPTPPRLPNGQTIKERLNLFGLAGVGKTHQFFQIAKWHQDLGSDARFYAINTDTSFEVLYFNPEFVGLSNIEWTDCTSFDAMYMAAKGYNSKLRPQDWLCIDLQDDAWSLVQDEYAQIRAKEAGLDIDDLSELWVEGGSTKEYPISGWDWQTPNARYRSFANNYVLRGPGHRFIISRQTDVMEPSSGMKEDAVTKANRIMFSPLGVKPGGQKEDPSRWHTILHVGSRGEKLQTIATAKERWGARKWMGQRMSNGQVRGEQLNDFFMDYLVNIAGWSLE
jgi:hypothetical protein